ncbi:MAG: TolC family protein [Calditrichia bacterium]
MVRIWNRILISSLLLLLNSSFAQEFLSLEESIQIGLNNNYTIQIARSEAEIDENNSSLGNAGFLPTLDVSAASQKSVQDSRQEFITGNISDRKGAEQTSQQASVLLNWTIFDGFKMFISYNKLKEIEQLGENSARAAIEGTVAQIIVAYYDVVRQKKNLSYIQENLAVSRERLKISEGNFDIGAGSKLSALQARVDFNTDSSALLQQQANFKQSQIVLNQLLARDIDSPFTVKDTITLGIVPDFAGLQAAALKQNAQLRMARNNEKISRLSLKEVKTQWLPQVDLRADYQWAKSQSEAGFLLENQTSGYTYGVNLFLNLFNGFNSWREAQNAKIGIRISRIQIEELKTRIKADLANVYEAYSNSLKRITLENENLNAASQNLDISLEQMRIGSINALELREAQQNLLLAEDRLTSAEFQAKVAETELLRLSGLLVNSDLEVPE